MESVAKVSGVVEGNHIVVSHLPFKDGETVELMVWAHRKDDLVPLDPNRTSEERVQALDEWIKRVKERHPRLPVLSDYSMSRESIYGDDGR